MAILKTSYDKTLKSRIFILKGGEKYASTTNVLADLISDFNDGNTHIGYLRCGLEIEVLREVGDGFINIYDGDDLIFETIPYSSEDMDEVIGSSWNAKGVFWDDGKLIIGTDDSSISGYADTGFKFQYGVEHNIRVQYTGNDYCLGSVSDIIAFNVAQPEHFKSSITATPSTTKYDHASTVSFTIKLTIGDSEENKEIKVYDNGTYVETIEVTPNDNETYTKSGLSDGLHSFRFIFEGDDEAYYSEKVVDVSIGYKVSFINNSTVPVVATGQTYRMATSVKDYFGNAKSGGTLKLQENDNGTYTDVKSGTVDSSGHHTFQNVSLSGKPYSLLYADGSRSEEITPILYTPTSISLTANPTMITNGVSSLLTATINPVQEGVLVYINNKFAKTDSEGKRTTIYDGTSDGDITFTATIGSTSSNSVTIQDVIQYWNSNSNVTNYNANAVNSLNMTKTVDGWVFSNNGWLVLENPKTSCVLELYLDDGFIGNNAEVVVGEGTNNTPMMSNNGSISLSEESARGYVDTLIKIEYDAENSQKKLYKDNTLITTKTYSTSSPCLKLNLKPSLTNGELRMRELKIKKVVSE